ncbi:MAG: outer membrane protein [Parvibaculaceae bacterium]
MNLKLRLLSTVAAAAMITGFAMTGARAADVLAEPMAHDWSGLYFGAHVGYGEASFDGCVDCGDDLDAGELDLSDFVGGGHLGYNIQMDSLVLGIEADFTWMGFDDTVNEAGGGSDRILGDVDYLASIRARAGYAMDEILIYATGGVAFTEAKIKGEQHGNFDKAKFNDVGGVVGGGLEWAASDMVSLRAEGLYYFFGDDEDVSDWHSANDGEEFEFDDAFILRVGASIHLGGL